MSYYNLIKKERNRSMYTKHVKYNKYKLKKLVYRNYRSGLLLFTVNYDAIMKNDKIKKTFRKKINGR